MIQRQPSITFESPSVRSRATGLPAYEIKFLVPEAIAREGREWLAAHAALVPDPLGGQAGPGAYSTTTLYLDTPEGDVYLGLPGYRTQKFRVRRYADTGTLFLERKRKVQDRVSKRRSVIEGADLTALGEASSAPGWDGHWFHRMARTRRLVPAACLSYEREALVGVTPDGPVRVTLDRGVRGAACTEWRVDPVAPGREMFPGRVIMELKFMGGMPVAFKSFLEAFRLEPSRVSKYRAWRGAQDGGDNPGDGAQPQCRSS